MRQLFAWSSALFLLLIPALAHASGRDDGSVESAPAEGPPAPEPSTEQPLAIVLPSRTGAETEVDGAAIDVLLASGLEDLGVEVLDRRWIRQSCSVGESGLRGARASYLDMDLDRSLELASAARSEQLEAHGDLLGCDNLTDAELFMVQVLLDLGRRDEAATLAGQILARQPRTVLDPVKYAPPIQQLWSEVSRERSGSPLEEKDTGRLVDLGSAAGVGWVVLGSCLTRGEDGERLSVLLVDVESREAVGTYEIILGAQGQWASSVRAALAEQFPPPDQPVAPSGRQSSDVETADERPEKTVWYRSWWFWTAVGAVVVGGTAGALGGYYANQDPSGTSVEMNPNW